MNRPYIGLASLIFFLTNMACKNNAVMAQRSRSLSAFSLSGFAKIVF
jgi:hypothetical protein